MKEAAPALGDQRLQPIVPTESVPMVPDVDMPVDRSAESLYDPTAIGLDSEDKVIGMLDLGVPNKQLQGSEERPVGASVLLLEHTNQNGLKELGMMGAQQDEQGNWVANQRWQKIPEAGHELILGRNPEELAPGATGVYLENLFGIRPNQNFTTVSRRHVALHVEGFGPDAQLFVRDLSSTNGTVLTGPRGTILEAEQPAAEPVESAISPNSQLIGRLGGQAIGQKSEIIDSVPGADAPDQTGVEQPVPVDEQTEQRALIASKIDGIDAMIAADSGLAEVREARQRLADILEDKRQNWKEARQPGSDQEVYGRQSRLLQEWEWDARARLMQLPESSRTQYDTLIAEQNRLRNQLAST